MSLTEFAPIHWDRESSIYKGKRAVLVTESYKQHQVKTILESSLGLHITAIETGDIEYIQRSSSSSIPVQYKSRERARQLAKTAMKFTSCTIGISTASYWGPDSVAGTLNLLSETIAFVDEDLDLEIFEKSLSYQLFDNEDPLVYCWKSADESDEPYREMVRKITHKLADRMRQLCPECGLPGWGILLHKQGLECRDCGLPTRETQSNIWYCTACNHTAEDGSLIAIKKADPSDCNYCSP